MSEYMERHDVSKLIGSPPGYVGYGEGGQLTEKIRRQPYSVVLFDEFEKAHPDVFNILLQILDEGWLTDSEGQRVVFTNCVIIGTSNLGSETITDRKQPIGIGSQLTAWTKDEESKEIFRVVKKFLRPEFINRLDEIIVFNSLGKNEFKQILDINIKDLAERLQKIGIELEFDEKAKDFVVESMDTTNYGARPLRRKLEDLIENKIASLIIENQAKKIKHVKVEFNESEIQILSR